MFSSGTQTAQQHGVLVLNKPAGPTSNRCLTAVKRLGQRKIGHAGTLDPMASGVLLLLLGQATKLSGWLMAAGEKVYAASLRLGVETDTWDAEGRVVAERPWEQVTPEEIREAVASWRGELTQTVPPYSAAKSQGRPLYELAREGLTVPVKTKTVHIFQTEILSLDLPELRFRVRCSSGTYVRSLAHSLGKRLSCGAVLTALTREYSHPFSLSQAVSLEELRQHPESLPEHVRPLEDALPGWPAVTLGAAAAGKVRNGIPADCPAESLDAIRRNGGLALLRDGEGPLALARLAMDGGRPQLAVARGLWSGSS